VIWSVGYDVNQSSSFSVSELDDTVASGKESVVLADSHIPPRVELCAALPDDNAASVNRLSRKNLYPEPLGVGVAAVLCRAATFSLRHLSPSLFPLFRWLCTVADAPSGDGY